MDTGDGKDGGKWGRQGEGCEHVGIYGRRMRGSEGGKEERNDMTLILLTYKFF